MVVKTDLVSLEIEPADDIERYTVNIIRESIQEMRMELLSYNAKLLNK